MRVLFKEDGRPAYTVEGVCAVPNGMTLVEVSEELRKYPLNYLRLSSGSVVIDVSDDPTVQIVNGEVVPTLAAAKAQKKARIESERDAQCEKPVQALGRTWNADKRSQELLASAITIAQAGGPLPVVWRDYDNDNMQVTSIDDLLAIAVAIAAQTQTAYTKSWARKEAVDAAQTLDEVEAA
jgi:hypothetical protein